MPVDGLIVWSCCFDIYIYICDPEPVVGTTHKVSRPCIDLRLTSSTPTNGWKRCQSWNLITISLRGPVVYLSRKARALHEKLPSLPLQIYTLSYKVSVCAGNGQIVCSRQQGGDWYLGSMSIWRTCCNQSKYHSLGGQHDLFVPAGELSCGTNTSVNTLPWTLLVNGP